MATSISFEPTTVNLTVYKGDSINIKFNLIEGSATYNIPALGSGQNLGWKSTIKKSSDNTKIGSFTVIGSAGNNYIEVYAPNSVTTTFVPGTEYKYDIQYTWVENSNTHLRTFVKGIITVLDDVTLATD